MSASKSMSPRSDGSETSPVEFDEKKRKRMISNRESARRSRMRKQQHLDRLVNELAHLKNNSSKMLVDINAIEGKYVMIESENEYMRAELWRLADRLKKLNGVLELVETVSGVPIEKEKLPEQLFVPWRDVPCSGHQPMMAASANMF